MACSCAKGSFNTLKESESVCHVDVCVKKCMCVLRCVACVRKSWAPPGSGEGSYLCTMSLLLQSSAWSVPESLQRVLDWVWPLVRTWIPCGTWPPWRKWHRTTAGKEWGRCDLWPLREVVTRALSWLGMLYLNLKPDCLGLHGPVTELVQNSRAFLFFLYFLFSFFCASIHNPSR